MQTGPTVSNPSLLPLRPRMWFNHTPYRANSASLLTAAERCCIVRANRLARSGVPQTSKSASQPARATASREVGTLSDLDNVTVRIADVAANLAVLFLRLRDELGSSTFPQLIARLNIRNADI